MKIILTIIFMLFCLPTFANNADFGQYRYSQYLGLQQQIQSQRANALRRQRMYQKSPTRNIQYPTSANPYPNIQRRHAARITPRQRYSAQYYRNL